MTVEEVMIDRYTKAILSIIAFALVIIAAQDLRPVATAQAQGGPVHVVVDSVASFALQFAGPLQVKQ
jgi:hypothetical protein